MAGQSNYNRFLTFSFWREFSSTTYVFALIALLGFGIGYNKPAATNSAIAMALWSTSRFATQRISERPLNQAIANLQAENYQVNATALTLQEALRENYGWYEKYRELEHQKEVAQNQIKELEQSCESIRSKWQEAERFNAEYQIEEKVWEEKTKARLAPVQAEVDRLKKACEHYQKEYRKTVDELNSAVERNAELAAQLEYAKIQIQALMAPKKLADDLDINKMANRLVDWFLRVNIAMDALEPIVDGTDWRFTFRLHDQRNKNRVAEYASAMKLDFSLPVLPSIRVDGDRVTIKAHRSEVERQSKYLRLDDEWLKEAFIFQYKGEQNTHHARFMGSTRTGKSTLICNAIGVIIQNIPGVEVILADPLVNGESNWDTLTPQYVGEQEALKGFKEFYESFKSLDRGESKKTHVRIFLLDEFDRMAKAYPEILADVKDLWKSGRHQWHYLWVSGQSPLVGEFKLNLNDTSNTIGCYLGDTIERGLSDASDTPDFKARLREEWLISKRREPYICLVRPGTPEGKLFLAAMPRPGAYALGGGRSAQDVIEEYETQQSAEYRKAEFDISKLEQLYENSPSDPDSATSDPTFGLPKKVLEKVKRLIGKGYSTAKIVKEVWGESPGKHPAYTSKRDLVDAIKKALG